MQCIRSFCRNEHGASLTFFAILTPLIFAFLGLCIDGGLTIYYRISLQSAADAATMSVVDAYDRNIWLSEGIVVYDEARARSIVTEVLSSNLPGAVVESLEIPDNAPNTCTITVKYSVPMVFLRVLDIDEQVLRASSESRGY